MSTISIGQRIKKERLEKRIKQGELAASIGVSQPYINQIESNKRTVSIEKLKAIAKALNVPVSTIADPDELEIIQKQGGFGVHEKKVLLRKEIDVYTHQYEEDPRIGRDSELGGLVYERGFQNWLSDFLSNLLQFEKGERDVILDCTKNTMESLMKNLMNMTSADRRKYKDSIIIIYALGSDFYEIKNKQKYIDFMRWVRSALLSSNSEIIKKALKEMLFELLDEECVGNKDSANAHTLANVLEMVYALGADFHDLKNKQAYIDFMRWVQDALLSSRSDAMKAKLQTMLSNLLDDEWGDK